MDTGPEDPHLVAALSFRLRRRGWRLVACDLQGPAGAARSVLTLAKGGRTIRARGATLADAWLMALELARRADERDARRPPG